MIPRIILLSCLSLLGATSTSAGGDSYQASLEDWRAKRYEALQDANGYLSFIGSGLVAEGDSRVGTAADNDIVLEKGPAHLGTLTYEAPNTLRFTSAQHGAGRISGEPFGTVELKTQLDDGGPTRIDFGNSWFYVVRTGDLIGWRLRDLDAPQRKTFTGIPHFPVDPDWRLEADWEPFDPPRTLQYITVLGTPEDGTVSGQAVFERDGERYVLWPTDADDGTLFFVFADRTSGRATYGGGRFVYAEAPIDGRVILDFNRAYNPPCALNSHVVCPTAPPENRLRLAVEAGELKPKES